MQLPTLAEIQALHKKYAPAPEVYQLVFTHCQIVSDIAEQLITRNNLPVDSSLVKAGCLLHDIGVYPLFDERGVERTDLHYITHGIRGAAILKEEGFSETICRFASHHTGVGLTKQDITTHNLPLPVEDYVAKTQEEKLVMYADKFHSKTEPPCLNSFDWYKQFISRHGAHKVGEFEQMAAEFGVPDLLLLSKRYGHRIRR
jgi:uncharacterized protein